VIEIEECFPRELEEKIAAAQRLQSDHAQAGVLAFVRNARG